MFNGLRLLVILRHIPTVIINDPLTLVILNVNKLRGRAIDYVMMDRMILCGHISLFDLIKPLELGLSEHLPSLELQFSHNHIVASVFIPDDYCTI
jgi:hypothetical protein